MTIIRQLKRRSKVETHSVPSSSRTMTRIQYLPMNLAHFPEVSLRNYLNEKIQTHSNDLLRIEQLRIFIGNVYCRRKTKVSAKKSHFNLDFVLRLQYNKNLPLLMYCPKHHLMI